MPSHGVLCHNAIAGLQVGVLAAWQYCFVDGFSVLSEIPQIVLLKKPARPPVKAPLHYRPKWMLLLESLWKLISLMLKFPLSWGFRILVLADLSRPPSATYSNIDFG